MVLRQRSATGKPRRWSDEQSVPFYRFCEGVIALFMRYWVRCYRPIGADHVPNEGGAFLVANHTTGMDPFILGAAVKNRVLSGPGKRELFKNPVVAFFMRKLGIFPLNVGQADAGAVRAMVDLYRRGRVIIVYPEGGRSKTGEMQEFTPDFTRLVIKLKAPIIPAGIAGGYDLLPTGRLLPGYHIPLVVVFGEPFDLSSYYGRTLAPDVLEEATQVLRGRVADLVAEAEREREVLRRAC
jgi:1-acyl-sn-glycerol-3-phosphate acyltransferase